MANPFSGPRERVDTRFSNPQEEIEYLRAQIAEKERALGAEGYAPERMATAYNELQAYKEKPAHEVLHDTHRLEQSEVEAIALDLPPDDDDAAVQELLYLVEEKGIKNALSVAEELKNPHLEDDLHRALVQYIAHGFSAPDLEKNEKMRNELSMTLFEVTLPDASQDSERPMREIVSAMEQFYLGMFGIDSEYKTKGDRYFAIEVAVSGDHEDIMFYLAVPSDKEDLFEKQLLSIFPKARAHRAPADYNVFIHEGATEAAYAVLTQNPILPLKDYRAFDQDPLSVLINTFTKIAPVGEGAAVQCIINPIGSRYDKRYRSILNKMEKGKSLDESLRDTPETMTGEVFKLVRELVKTPKKEDTDATREKKEERRPDEKLIEAIRRKMETPIPAVNIRVVASAQTPGRAHTILEDIISSFNQFYEPTGNRLRFERLEGKALLHLTEQFTFRTYSEKQALPLSVRELTTLMHFPTYALSATPQLKRLKAAEAPSPIGLPASGTKLGFNEFRGAQTPIYLTPEDRLRHLYVIGQTGTGKSKFLLSLILQDIANGDGVCFIDPHGEDVNWVLQNIPEHRMKDVIYFDPADTQHVLGLNMLEYDPRFPEQKTFVINELFSIFKKLYSGTPESMGPAFEQYFRNATALVMEDPSTGNTMLDISRVLADAKYREVKLSRSKNPIINQFWREIATKAQGEASLANIVPYITNKFDIFTANDIMRPIIAQQVSAFRMREVMDNRKILLVNLSKGKLGDINANLLGMVLVGKMLMAALSRVDALASDLPPFYLYIDEFQNITTDSISAILSEARKYKLSLNVAHQFIAQLDEGIRDAVFGNVGNLVVFRVGFEDAQFLENQFKPVFEVQDIMNIENYHAYTRLLARGIPQKPFSFKTTMIPRGSPERALQVKTLSQQTYGKSGADIDREVRMRYGIG
jgi:hypothetical protein